MSTRQKRNSRLNGFIVPVICVTLSSYFAYHSMIGNFGLQSQKLTVEETSALKIKLSALQAERKELEKRVLLLKDGTIEYDMLDEQVRYQLNLLDENEIVLFYD